MNKSDYYKACLAKGKRPQGMGYGDYSSYMKAEGGDPMDEDDYNGMEEDEDGMREKSTVSKSDTNNNQEETVDADALSKALEDYDNTEDALGTAGNSRESYLQARLDAGTITKSERKELGGLWADDGADEAPMRKSLGQEIEDDNEDAAALVDASEFLKSLVDSVDRSLDSVTAEVTRDGHATRELLKAQGGLVKALVRDQIESRQLIKSQSEIIAELGKRLGVVEGTPAPRRAVGKHDPRSVQGRQFAKSASAASDGDDQLSKSQVNHGLRTLMIKADEAGDDKAKQRIAHATARFEYDGHLPSNMVSAIQSVLS
jgi:hypothetical protein